MGVKKGEGRHGWDHGRLKGVLLRGTVIRAILDQSRMVYE